MSDGKARVTAGVPGLTPNHRAYVDALHRRRDESQNTLEQAIRKDVETTAPDGDRPTTDLLSQMGRAMSHVTFMAQLRQLNPTLYFEVSNADVTKIGIYQVIGGEKRFILGMENGTMPEFSVRHTEFKSVPDCSNPGSWKTIEVIRDETRGWRTVLARLIRGGFIQPSEAEKAFAVASGRDSKNWQTLTT